MSLAKCPECGAQISDKALSCPQCGYQNLLEKGITQVRKIWPMVLTKARIIRLIWIYTAICLITTLICLANRQIIEVLAVSGKQFDIARTHTLLTYSFAHGSIVHWFFNMLILIPSGIILEPKIGSLKTMTIILAGILTTGVSYSLFGSDVSMIGSRGAIYATLGGIIGIWVLKLSSLNLVEKSVTVFLCLLMLWNFLLAGPASTRITATGFLAAFLAVFIFKRKGKNRDTLTG